MKKKTPVNHLEALWRAILLDGNIYRIAEKYRKKLGFPIKGFNTLNDYEQWYKKNIEGNKKKEKDLDIIWIKFTNEILKNIEHVKYYINEISLKILLLNYFINSETDYKRIEQGGEFGVFKTICVENGKKINGFSKEGLQIDDGIYIKIGPYSSSKSIKRYVDKKAYIIKSEQEFFKNLKNLPDDIKFSNSKKWARDSFIVYLNNSYSKRELEEFFKNKDTNKRDTKNQVIRDIINYVLSIKIQENTVKMVLQRRRTKKGFLKNKKDTNS